MLHELSRFTLAGGVGSLKHDDAIDLLNQLSEIDLYAPASTESMTSTEITEDGIIWESLWDDDDDDFETNSNVF